MTDTPVIEAQLLRWSESHNGRTVTLQLPADGDHPFRGLPCGPANGQRLAIAVALINDDETTTPVEPPSTGTEKPKGGGNGGGADRRRFAKLPNSTQAALACKSRAFRRWLIEERGARYHVVVGDTDDDPDGVATADIFIKGELLISSKTDLDKSIEAGDLWQRLYAQFVFWRDNP